MGEARERHSIRGANTESTALALTTLVSLAPTLRQRLGRDQNMRKPEVQQQSADSDLDSDEGRWK